MKVYIISQAWEGDIRGVYVDRDEAQADCDLLTGPPAVVEEHDLIQPKAVRDAAQRMSELRASYERAFPMKPSDGFLV